ncbi:MAG TPA: urate oxidase [Thermoanaerobaculia bacterium]|jgi:urate oxidase|nr:urate oxidase [Thermoanaerobaculia bacterium]
MLAENNYGKSGIRLVKVARREGRHDLRDLTVAVRFEGEFADAHVRGDNAAVLPTDTMKNTVYALAKDRLEGSLESFGLALCAHFLEAAPAVSKVTVKIAEHSWERLLAAGAPHPHAFVRGGAERRLAEVSRTRDGPLAAAGIEGMTILKSGNSGFEGFLKDRFTTLPEVRDRIFATVVQARWDYSSASLDFDRSFERTRQVMLETFAVHESASVQHTLHAMGEAALAAVPEITTIRLSLPNKHHLLVDLSRFGLENNNEIFVATDEPFGLIEATIRRRR